MASSHRQAEHKQGEHKEHADGVDFNRVEIEKIRSFLDSLDKKEKGTCSIALTGMSSHSLTPHASGITQSNSWILDSGATDYMTPLSHCFITYSPCSSSKKITLANGSLTTVASQGDIILNNHLTLKDVLHVPKLFTNLISIQKLTLDNNYSVNFSSTCCEIQGQGLKKRIGLAIVRAGLYYFDGSNGEGNKGKVNLVSCLV